MINQNGGILILNKSGGMTSHDAVNRVRRLYGTKQVGHTGTLDPMATGVLVVLVGRAVKCAEFFDGAGDIVGSRKCYRAILRLGMATDTGDITGTVTASSEFIPSECDVIAAVDHFNGDIMQVPPMYSALKRGGVKLADLARRGIIIEREPRPITIHSIKTEKISETDYELAVDCSKGTYIRVLCSDIGEMLGCFGTMAALERTAAHSFSLADSITLEALEQLELSEREKQLKQVIALFDGLAHIELPPFFVRLARSGCEIYQEKIGTALKEGEYAVFCDSGEPFAVALTGTYPGGSAIKPVKQIL
jgi:tRNA pseudouridine 55 synthase